MRLRTDVRCHLSKNKKILSSYIKMKKSKPTFTRRDWIHIQVTLLCVVVAISAMFNVIIASELENVD